MKDFKKLQVWQDSVSLVTKIYVQLNKLPQSERYGLYSQMTRAAVSIPSNIAEGSGRRSDKEYRRFFRYSSRFIFRVGNSVDHCTEPEIY